MKRRAKVGAAKRRKPKRAASYDVIALVASAGGHIAIESILRALPAGFPVPIVVMQHFPPDVAEPLRSFARYLPFTVVWARASSVLGPGCVLVAPPRSFLEILPDGTCAISPCERGPRDKPIDRLLRSLARSFAHQAIGVVLSGMMDDGADGARELRAAGGSVIVQSGADYGEMPRAAVRSGGADVVIPIEQIGSLLIDLAAGAAISRPVSELQAVETLFAGDGQARAAMRAVNWTATPLGPVREWSQALTTTVKNQISSSFPTCIFWGPALVQIYNEAFLPLLGAKQSPAGKPARLIWPELWSSMGPRLESVLQTGKAVFAEDQLFQLERHGFPEECYLTYSNSPLYDTDGTVRGVLVTATETTERVRASRRLKVLRDLAAIKGGESTLLVAEQAAKVLADAPLDVPFALLYLFDKGHNRANLAAAVGVQAGSVGAPHALLLSDDQAVWPLADVVRSESHATVSDLAARLPGVQVGPWPESPSSAMLLPLWSGAEGMIAGIAVLGLSPRLRFDPTYEDFVRVIGQHVSTALGEAEARSRERERSDRLAELDRAKVDFFSNVSHEFRTPLTLLLGPLEEMLARRRSLPADLGEAIEAAARNGHRLLALVNTLLDFSQTESHREQARFEATDLAALTTDISSAFRSAVQAAGLQFEVRCESDLPAVAVDRQMWEKIVSNLLSNALKFTFEGKIEMKLRALSLHAELVIKDTGVGIPKHEIPNLFKRFHRVRGARARTAEGSGIGLWMVDDLVKRIGGMLRVQSKENAGTAFTIWVPYKCRRIGVEPSQVNSFRPTEFATQMAREVSRWATNAVTSPGAPSEVLEDVFGPPQALASSLGSESLPARILVVDDNADMRDYFLRLLSPRWRVDTAADGARAFGAAVDLRPDVIVADVMMPGVDGFELLKRVRGHQELRHTPVVLVTARAGEETAIEGLMAGADDYIAKPFSPRELVARISAAVERARAEAALRRSEAELLARNEELERFNEVTVGRELRMIELKKLVNALRGRLGEPPYYPLAFEEVEGSGDA
jgi:signal transduction histidine kinase/chemotaxis response regulator CheB